jgi:hypothetical protein
MEKTNMRRSICYCDPNTATAGEKRTWQFIYTTSVDLPKGTLIKFDLNTYNREFDWKIPKIDTNKKENIIWAEMPNKKNIKPKKCKESNSSFIFTLPAELQVGQNLIILMGTPLADQSKGNQCQTYIQRKRIFDLHIDPKGKGDFKESDSFHLDVKGNELYNLRIITPSFVSRNKRFDVMVRFEDRYNNLTNNAPEDTLIELSYEHKRENLCWKLFIPETGFISLPNLYFNEPGIYKIQLKNLKTNQIFFSPPIKCFAESDFNLFWGLLHGESTRVDSGKNIENFLRHCRDEKALQFVSTSNFDSEKETSNDIWKTIANQISEFNEDERFTSLLGFNWAGSTSDEGMRQFIYLKDNKPIMRKKDLKNNSLKKIYKTHNYKDLISIPSFTMNKSTCFDFADFNPEFERVVEIYNSWGSSECSLKEGNLRPIDNGKKGTKEVLDGSIRKALGKNCRFGFVAGGLDDRGVFEKFYDSDQKQYSPGLTAIITKNHTRESIFSALYNRSCYATTGARILLQFSVAQETMGKELSTQTKPGLLYNRYISGLVVGVGPLKEVSIIRNGKILTTFETKDEKFEFEMDDSQPLDKIALKSPDERPPFVYYYLRIIQADGQIAWSSPIWIDLVAKPSKKTEKKVKA